MMPAHLFHDKYKLHTTYTTYFRRLERLFWLHLGMVVKVTFAGMVLILIVGNSEKVSVPITLLRSEDGY